MKLSSRILSYLRLIAASYGSISTLVTPDVLPASLRMSPAVLSSKWRCWPSLGFLVVSMPLAVIDSERPPTREPDDLNSSHRAGEHDVHPLALPAQRDHDRGADLRQHDAAIGIVDLERGRVGMRADIVRHGQRVARAVQPLGRRKRH